MTSSGEKGKILADFKDADSQMTGDMKTSSTAAIDATFSGENAVLTGNINTMETSYQWGYGYVPNRSTVTVTFSGKNASFAGNIDTTQTSRTGTWGNYVDSPNHSTVTASFSAWRFFYWRPCLGRYEQSQYRPYKIRVSGKAKLQRRKTPRRHREFLYSPAHGHCLRRRHEIR